jgi:hypothetical protein
MSKYTAPMLALVLTLSAAGAPSAVAASLCGGETYQDSQGHCVRRPTQARTAPSGASAKCRDGTYSFSHSRSGTCSHHGGVAEWL